MAFWCSPERIQSTARCSIRRVLDEIGWRSISAETVGEFSTGLRQPDGAGLAAAWLCPAKGRANTHALSSADRSSIARVVASLSCSSAAGVRGITPAFVFPYTTDAVAGRSGKD